MNRVRLFLFFSVVLFSSCSNELDLLDDWKETMVVYGLLNQADTIQYIKINKAYLGEGNALQMAQAYDSINYANQLNVQLERRVNGSLTATYTLQKDSSISKNPGIFSYPKQILYVTQQALYDDSEYQLIITNTVTGKVVKSKTKLVKNLLILYPSPSQIINLTNAVSPQKVKWISAENGKLYQLTIRFHYDEKEITSGVITPKYTDWGFSAQKSISISGGENMEVSFMGSDFYKFLKAMISPNSNVERKAGNLDFIFSVAGNDFNTYMEVYQPSNGIVQEKPEYTNIENGIGLFSSRLNVGVLNRPLSNNSLDSLYGGQYTSGLGFQ